jgi:hypothetical protein
MQKSITAIGLLGPRIQEEVDKEANKLLFDKIIPVLDTKYTREGYYIVTTGCDEGFGKDVFWYCQWQKIKFVQLDSFLFSHQHSKINRVQFASQEAFLKILKCRHAAILELCGEFHLKIYYKPSVIDDMLNRVKLSDKPYHLYDHENSLIEHRGDLIGLKEE